MKTRMILLPIMGLILSGCLQTETKIKVEKDGSGTVEQRVIMRKDIVEMMQGMQAAMGGASASGSAVFNEVKLKEDASRMGPGVRMLEARPITTEAGSGYVVRYGFTDINRIKVPETPLLGDTPANQPGGISAEGSIITFKFRKGNPAVLEVLFRKDEGQKGTGGEREGATEEEKGEKEGSPEQDIAMMKEFLRDMKLSIRVEVGGTITSTNADYRSGSVITLMDVDFNALLQNKEAFEKLITDKVGTLDELKEFSRTYRGLQMETKEQVQIKFR
ncbi:MAG: hypothetical protein N2442_11820 [Spirochaetes bacterium]|nr:hypothetical protein [Spirochaetota bacterium]